METGEKGAEALLLICCLSVENVPLLFALLIGIAHRCQVGKEIHPGVHVRLKIHKNSKSLEEHVNADWSASRPRASHACFSDNFVD